jgi:hypothetical protein
MSLQPNVRVVTDKTTIPAPSALTGTVTPSVVGDSYVLLGTGTLFNSELLKTGDPHLFIWIPSSSILTRLKGVQSDTVLIVEDDVTSVGAGSTIYAVYGNLLSWSITNIGSTTYVLNGTTIAATEPPINERINAYNNTFNLLYPAWVDGTSTTLHIYENNV